jgi:hypothetical protein
MRPALQALSNAATANVTEAIEAARAKKLDDDLDDFLAKRFGRGLVAPLKAVHEAEEGRPIETLWDATREAGKLLKLAA